MDVPAKSGSEVSWNAECCGEVAKLTSHCLARSEPSARPQSACIRELSDFHGGRAFTIVLGTFGICCFLILVQKCGET